RDQDAAYWLERFNPAPAPLDLPPPAANRTFAGAYRDYALPADLCQRLREFTRAQGTTLFTSVLSAFAALLSRHSERGDLVLGTSVAGRAGDGTDHLVGMLVRTLPLRVTVGAEHGFRELCDQVRDTLAAVIRFDTGRFDERWIDRLWADFQALLATLLAHPDTVLGELPLLSEEEQLRVRTLGHRELAFDETLHIHQALERHAAERP